MRLGHAAYNRQPQTCSIGASRVKRLKQALLGRSLNSLAIIDHSNRHLSIIPYFTPQADLPPSEQACMAFSSRLSKAPVKAFRLPSTTEPRLSS